MQGRYRYIGTVLVLSLLLWAYPASADTDLPPWYGTAEDGASVVHLYFFWHGQCPHCRDAKPFLNSLAEQFPWLKLHSHALHAPEPVRLYQRMAAAMGEEARSVPAFFFCDRLFIGYDNAQGVGAMLRDALLTCHAGLNRRAAPSEPEPDTSALDKPLLAPEPETAPAPVSSAALTPEKTAESLIVPGVGKVSGKEISLPLYTLIIAGLDAFNPCAFFVLLFLLSLLVHARSRARMLFIGGVFVFFSGLVYFLFMAAWLNLFQFIGQLDLITLGAGLLAVLVALVNIKDFFYFKRGLSLSIPDSAKPGLYQRMRGLLNADRLLPLTFGTITLALAANTYELLCTSGFPMVYTRLLTLNELPTSVYYLYLLFYNLVYIVPLLLIVLLFTFTLGARKLSEEEGRSLKLLSGLMMFGLGLLLIVEPALLNEVKVAVGILIWALVMTWWLRRWRLNAS